MYTIFIQNCVKRALLTIGMHEAITNHEIWGSGLGVCQIHDIDTFIDIIRKFLLPDYTDYFMESFIHVDGWILGARLNIGNLEHICQLLSLLLRNLTQMN